MAEIEPQRYPQPEDFLWSEEPTASITYDLTHDYLTVRFGEVRPLWLYSGQYGFLGRPPQWDPRSYRDGHL